MTKIKFKMSSNYIFGAVLLATLIVLLLNIGIGQKQEKTFVAEGIQLAQARKLVDEGSLEKAEELYSQLLAKYQSSYPLLEEYAHFQVMKGDYVLAVHYFRKAEAEFPLIVEDSRFSLNMGESLYNIKEYREAAKYLQLARLLTDDINDQEKIEQLLSNITRELGR